MLLFALAACVEDTWEAPVDPPVVPGAPVVGAAEGFLKLPAGTPLSGYSVRCQCLSGQSRPDMRDSAYTSSFVPSAGVQTHPTIKVVWIENGDDHLVITKTDSIYSYDGLVTDLERRLTAATGIDLDGKVIHTANHSHASYGDFSDAITFYLGSDKYNEEIFQRFSSQVADVAVEAYENRVDAAIGMQIVSDWDPDDRVYRDRRGINNDVLIGPEDNPLPGGKDPNVALMRFDSVDGDPLAVIVNFGMHGIIVSEQSALVSTDSGGGVEAYLQEAFDDEVVVMFTQGSGGDQSPAGEQSDFAKIESVGERARPLLYDIWDSTETSSNPIAMQTASRAVRTHPSTIHVTRGGTVDWYYNGYEEGFTADGVIYDDQGNLMSPFDEFNTDLGAVFCGDGFELPLGGIEGTIAEEYATCIEVGTLGPLIGAFFDVEPTDWGLPADAEPSVPLPLPDTLWAGTTASRIDGLSVVRDGETQDDNVLLGFFPGESTSMYNEHFRRRASAELGYETAVMFGYSQDHEGYLLIPEDWMLGEYEADIVVWGPLVGEHIMESVLNYSDELLADAVHQHPDPLGEFPGTQYPVRPLPTVEPDETPEAGTQVTTVPDHFWLPTEFTLDLSVPETVPRVQGIVQFAWKGGDPGVDDPVVTLEFDNGGTWETVTSRSGRAITDSFHDILKATTPDPVEFTDGPREHYWWATWQAVGHVEDRVGLPLGTYRFRVDGKHYTGGSETWPWNSADYSFTTQPFELVPGALAIERTNTGLSVSLPATSQGWRYVAAGGNAQGDNAPTGPFSVRWITPGGVLENNEVGTVDGGRIEIEDGLGTPIDATSVEVTDAYGNVGTLTLD